MTAGTPGQAAHEAYWNYLADEFSADAADPAPAASWASMPDWKRRAIEAGAKAGHKVIAAQDAQPAPGAALDVAVEALRVIALGVELNALGLGQPIDPSVTADKALVAIRDLRAADPKPARDLDDLFTEALASFTQEPKPAPGLAAAIRAYFGQKAAEFSAEVFPVRPQDMRVSAADILAIVDQFGTEP